jgi:hypothetical protein
MNRIGVRLLFIVASSQNGFDARDQFTRIERLGEVIIRAQFETDDLINIFVTRRKHNDRRLISAGAQFTADFKTIKFREHYIHTIRRDDVLRPLQRGRHPQLLARNHPLKIHARELNDGRFVVTQDRFR